MGLLDILNGNFQAQPLGGLLYPSPVKTEAEMAQEAREAAAARLAGRGAAASPFGPLPAMPEQPAPLAPFAPGAVPFGFAGPGSMNVTPSQPASPAPAAAPAVPPAAPLASAAPAAPVPMPVPRPAAADAPTDVSSVNRGAPDAAPAAAPAAPAAPVPFGFGNRLSNLLQTVQGSKGLIPSIVNATTSAVTGERTDPAGVAGNATAKALQARGASAEDIAAAQSNPAMMQQLITQHYGPKQVQPLGEGYVWDSRQGKAVKAYEPAKAGGLLNDVASRKAAAEAMGLKPSDPAYQGFVLAGKWPKENEQPLSAGDKKAIQEADDKILSINQAIDNLNQAKTLSRKAYEGPMASQRGYVSSMFGSQAGTDTADLENLVTTNSLSQLKAIFGGNPTEGERKILLDVQGSVNQPDAVRQRIWDRAIQMAQSKLSQAQQRSNELRGGNFYKPGGGMTAPPAAPLSSGKTSSGISWSVQ